MLIPDDIIPVVKDEHIAFEGGFLVVDGHTGLKAGVGRLDVPVTVVDADDRGLVIYGVIHIVFLLILPLCGCKKVFGN